MPKFIKLTEMVDDGRTAVDVWLNTSDIVSFKIAKSDRDTMLIMRDRKYFFIKQKPNQISEMLGEDVIK